MRKSLVAQNFWIGEIKLSACAWSNTAFKLPGLPPVQSGSGPFLMKDVQWGTERQQNARTKRNRSPPTHTFFFNIIWLSPKNTSVLKTNGHKKDGTKFIFNLTQFKLQFILNYCSLMKYWKLTHTKKKTKKTSKPHTNVNAKPGDKGEFLKLTCPKSVI